MKPTAYYNENDPFAAAWLRNLIASNLICYGDVDERSIAEVKVTDLATYTQCHFFAGIGGWSYALRLANWNDSRPIWTGSCPCQPFSPIGLKKGENDERHLWPTWRSLIEKRHPTVIFGEQSSNAVDWLRGVRSDLARMDYAVAAIPIEAASAGAQFLGDRFYFVAAANGIEFRQKPSTGKQPNIEYHTSSHTPHITPGDGWYRGFDGKLRRLESSINWLAYGIPNRVGKLRGYGNAIHPETAKTFIAAAMAIMP